MQLRSKKEIIEWLHEQLTIDRLWDVMELFEEHPFYTMRNLEFTYIIKGNEMFVNRKEKSITKATVGITLCKALELGGIVSGPKKLGTFGGELPVSNIFISGNYPTGGMRKVGYVRLPFYMSFYCVKAFFADHMFDLTGIFNCNIGRHA